MTSLPDRRPPLRSIHRQMPFVTLRVIMALILREMATTFGRKPGGYVWVIIEPIAGIALMTAAFTALGMRYPALGTNFAIFYATGLLPFYMFIHVSSKVSQALKYSSRLLAYPRVTVVDALLARFVLNVLTELLVAYIVLAWMLTFLETGTQLVLLPIVTGFAMAALLGLGIGTLNCFLTSLSPMYGTFWSLITRPIVLVSGVMFLIDTMPSPWNEWLLWNPLVHVVAETRSGFYHGYDPAYVSPVYVMGIALVCGVAGLVFLWKLHRDILEL